MDSQISGTKRNPNVGQNVFFKLIYDRGNNSDQLKKINWSISDVGMMAGHVENHLGSYVIPYKRKDTFFFLNFLLW